MSRVLAVDVGKTGCRCALYAGDGSAVGTGHGPGADGLASRDGVRQALDAVLGASSGLDLTGLGAVGVGAAGAAAAGPGAAELAARLSAGFGGIDAVVTSDVVSIHAGALGGGPGVVLAAGTGAVALAVRPDGTHHQVDGWGPWLGDEGGGAWIGRAGLQAVLRAADGRGPATALVTTRLAPDVRGLPAAVGAGAHPVRQLAAFAPDVAAAASGGDAVCRQIVTAAAGALAASVRAAVSWAGGRPRVALCGGLLELGPVLVDPLRAGLAGLDLRVPNGSALDGARLLTTDRTTVHERGLTRLAAAVR